MKGKFLEKGKYKMMNSLRIFLFVVIVSSALAQKAYRPKTQGDAYCMVPFEYQGKLYHDCTTEGDSRPWCRPAEDTWGYCAPGPDFSKCNIAPPNVTAKDIQLIVDLINNIRLKEPALRMAKIRWNTELAHRAQFMSNRCTLGSDDTSLCSGTGQMGQISYATMSSEQQPKKWTQFILEFYNKKSAYNFETNTCSESYCNGYKQLVNDKTTDIGCAVSSCMKDSMYADYYFCNFFPPIYMGKPYEKGEGRCQNCFRLADDYSFRCSNNLCEICDQKTSECQGKEQLKMDIESGKVCDDLDERFCRINAEICPNVDLLPDQYKQLIIGKCKKTCKLC